MVPLSGRSKSDRTISLSCYIFIVLCRLGEAKASGNLGNTLKVMGKFEEAVICCRRHLEICRSRLLLCYLLKGQPYQQCCGSGSGGFVIKWPPGTGDLLFIKYSKEFQQKSSIFIIFNVLITLKRPPYNQCCGPDPVDP